MSAMMIHLLVVASLAVSATWAANNGPITININGKYQTKYVVSADWARNNTRVNNKTSVTLVGGGRVYLGDSASDTLSTTSFYQMPLLGKRFRYNVDLSQVGCNCNGALYAISMPAYNSRQQPTPGDGGDYYCDANEVGGTYCPEMDIMEANRYAMASTAHTCKYLPPHYYSSCDRGGCGTNILDSYAWAYGPGKEIDTSKMFEFSVAFIVGDDGNLKTVSNSFSQGDKVVKFDSCRSDYLKWMGKSLPGIVVSMSLWGTGPGGMSWLDGKSGCQGGCDVESSIVTFSSFRLEDL